MVPGEGGAVGISHLDYLMDEIKSNEAHQAERDSRMSLNRFLETRQTDTQAILTTNQKDSNDDLATRVSYFLT